MFQNILYVFLLLSASVFLPLLLFIGSLIGFYKWFGSLKISKYCRAIPEFKFFPLISYWLWVKYIFTRKNPRVTIHEVSEGICNLFERERIWMFWLGFRPLIICFKPEINEALLKNSTTITKSAEYGLLNCWLGTGLLTSSGKKWHSHRKLLTPAFHFNILKNFLSVFNSQANVLTDKLAALPKHAWIDVVPSLTACALDIICETAMGVRMNAQSNGCESYAKAIDKVSDIFFYRVARPWLWIDWIFLHCYPSGREFNKNLKFLHKFTRKVIRDKKKEMIESISNNKIAEDDGKERKAFLELLLEYHLKDETFTEENIREEVDTFMFEGHDTTAASMSWTLYLLGRHSNIQEKVYQELQDIFEGDMERPVTSEDLTQMKYLQCVIKESLRLHPSVNFIGRELTEDLKVSAATGVDYILPKGSCCLLMIMKSHQDPEQFPNPKVFDPDRFLPENVAGRHPYAYIPFSAGPRNCIGQKFALMEEKTVIAHVLRKFKLTSLDPPERISSMAGLIVKNVEPIRIRFEKR